MQQFKDLIIKGSEHLRAGEFAKAQKVSQKLIKAGLAQGYLLKFQAHQKRDQTQEALKILREYTVAFPKDLIAWKTLAEFCRDQDFFDEGIMAYDQALECHEAPLEKIYLARASTLLRASRYEEALVDLEKISDSGEMSLPVRVMKLSCYNGLDQCAKSLERAPEILADIEMIGEEVLENSIPMLNYNTRFEIARANWNIHKDQSKSLQNLFQALRFIQVAPPPALQLLREINSQDTNAECKLFEVIISAKTKVPTMEHGHPHDEFVRQYEVMAEDPDECLEFICELETQIKSNSLRIRKVGDANNQVDGDLKGVYFQSLPELLHNHH
ncbi:hypothetical protein HOF92_03350 [bacterium]|jgi:tetratricopeptide (TPR) repeat protein|nr:hypothetical protein [bacterium]